MEEFFGRIGIIILVAVVAIIILVVVILIAVLRNRKKIGIYKNYIKQNFPDFPEDKPFFTAKQKSKTVTGDISLLIDEDKKELILLLAGKGNEIDHKIFPFRDLAAVESSGEIISRGIAPNRIYSYRKTMVLKFKDGSSYNFILENISNQHGDDKGRDDLENIFAPWEAKLKEIIE
jgi:hypothetical protein